MNKKLTTLLLIAFVISSCSNFNNKNEASGNESEKSESSSNADNFFSATFSELKFTEHLKGIVGEGASFKTVFDFLNNTDSKITEFTLRYYIKAKFKDGTVYYFPGYNGLVNNTEDDYKRFNDINTLEYTLPSNDVWLPKTTRKFDLTVYSFWVSEANNISKSEFKRTPEVLILAFKYKAISVDNEYEKVISYDILPYWKSYQQEIGLR